MGDYSGWTYDGLREELAFLGIDNNSSRPELEARLDWAHRGFQTYAQGPMAPPGLSRPHGGQHQGNNMPFPPPNLMPVPQQGVPPYQHQVHQPQHRHPYPHHHLPGTQSQYQPPHPPPPPHVILTVKQILKQHQPHLQNDPVYTELTNLYQEFCSVNAKSNTMRQNLVDEYTRNKEKFEAKIKEFEGEINREKYELDRKLGGLSEEWKKGGDRRIRMMEEIVSKLSPRLPGPWHGGQYMAPAAYGSDNVGGYNHVPGGGHNPPGIPPQPNMSDPAGQLNRRSPSLQSNIHRGSNPGKSKELGWDRSETHAPKLCKWWNCGSSCKWENTENGCGYLHHEPTRDEAIERRGRRLWTHWKNWILEKQRKLDAACKRGEISFAVDNLGRYVSRRPGPDGHDFGIHNGYPGGAYEAGASHLQLARSNEQVPGYGYNDPWSNEEQIPRDSSSIRFESHVRSEGRAETSDAPHSRGPENIHEAGTQDGEGKVSRRTKRKNVETSEENVVKRHRADYEVVSGTKSGLFDKGLRALDAMEPGEKTTAYPPRASVPPRSPLVVSESESDTDEDQSLPSINEEGIVLGNREHLFTDKRYIEVNAENLRDLRKIASDHFEAEEVVADETGFYFLLDLKKHGLMLMEDFHHKFDGETFKNRWVIRLEPRNVKFD